MNWKTINKKELILNLIVFTLCKSCLVISPLFLSNVMDLPTYGLFEYGLSIAGILAILMSCGIPISYPFYMLKKRRTYNIPSFLFHFFIIIFLLLIFFLLSFLGLIRQGMKWSLCLSLIGTLVYIISTIYKTHEKPIKAVIFDTLLYISLLFFCIAILIYSNLKIYLFHFLCVLLISLCGYFYFVFGKHLRINSDTFKQYKKLIKYGIPLIVNSLLIVLLTSSGRLLIKGFLSEEAVGIYSFYFRISGGIIILQQFVNILFYKKLFIIDKLKLDKYLSAFYLLLIFINIVLFFLMPTLLKPHLKLLASYEEYRHLHWILTIQVVTWITISFNEGFIYRENLSVQFSKILLILIPASFVFVLAAYKLFNLNLVSIVFIHFTIMFVGFLLQVKLLEINSWKLTRVKVINYVTYLSVVCVFISSLIK